ncbi:MAG: hypothetical protein ACREQF_09295 [Candidatus Binataceae bacterium]
MSVMVARSLSGSVRAQKAENEAVFDRPEHAAQQSIHGAQRTDQTFARVGRTIDPIRAKTLNERVSADALSVLHAAGRG